MAINAAPTLQSDVINYIAKKTLPLARKQLVAHQFGDPETLPKGMGSTWTATRWQRLPLPFAPLAEGVPPAGEPLTIQQVSCQALQWGDGVKVTDIAEMTIFHAPFQKAIELVGLQIGETLDRNCFNALMATTQVNFVNSRGSRASLVSGDVLDTTTVLRTVGALETLGAIRFMGDEQTDTQVSAANGGARASDSPRGMPHYVGICHPLVVADWSSNATVILSRSYSDVNRLYNYEIGEWGGTRWCKSNMVPTFLGVAATNGAAVAGGGTFTAGTWFIQVTGQDTQNQYESRISAASTGIVVAANGSISLTTPNVAGFTFNVYVGTSSSPNNLGLSAAGPTSGPLQGQATQLPANTAVTITGVGIQQVPPATPAVGVTVFPSFVIGKGAYAIVKLDDVKYTYLKDADKSDWLNQLRIVGWKVLYGVCITNQQFIARIESTSAFSSTFG
ncbi:MAG TPA: N4-gp56 family major capsid protein [Candidatus Cybelea sp.]|nr:N4-gp56 family major capsid protein [Candidatus Cybelea sp.]